MQSFFKTKKITVDGVEITVQELSAKDYLDFAELPPADKAATICSRCVLEWKGETAESINGHVPVRLLSEVMQAIFQLSGLDEPKNSEPTPSAGSSSG